MFNLGESCSADNLLSCAQRALQAKIPELYGERLAKVSVVAERRRRNSRIVVLRAATDLGERRFLAKQIVPPATPLPREHAAGRAAAEFEQLERLWPQFAALSRVGVPRPIAVFPEYDALLMEHAEGRLLSDLLWLPPLSARPGRMQVLRQNFLDCGRLLRHFQAVTQTDTAQTSVFEPLLTRCDGHLRRIEAARDPRIPAAFCRAAGDLVARQFRAIEGSHVRMCGRHGDFTPGNVISGPNGIRLIDFGVSDSACALFDIAQMLIALELLSRRIGNMRWPFSAFSAAFLEGVGSLCEASSSQRPLCESLLRIAQIAAMTGEPRQDFLRRWQCNRYLALQVAWFADRKVVQSDASALPNLESPRP